MFYRMRAMKQLFLILLILFLPFASYAEKLRPSWSQGLPDKPTAAPKNISHKINHDNLPDEPTIETYEPNTEIDLEINLNRNDINLSRKQQATQAVSEKSILTIQQRHMKKTIITTTEPKQKITSQSQIHPKNSKPETESSSVTAQATTQSNEPKQAPNSTYPAYTWNILKSMPITSPKSYHTDQSTVQLIVTIDPSGRVIQTKPTARNEDRVLARHAMRSIKKWRFDAPEKYGIKNPVTKTLSINLMP